MTHSPTFRLRLFFVLAVLLCYSPDTLSQCNGWTDFELEKEIFTNPAFGNATTPERDDLGRPYVYLASIETGVRVYDISGSGEPILDNTITTESLGTLDAIDLYQDSTYLYVTLGNIWSAGQESGLAIIDVSDPTAPIVVDIYSHPGTDGGAGAVCIVGDIAYLAAMAEGLIVLDVAEPDDIQFLGHLPLENDYPHSQIGGDALYNARGIDVQDDIAYVCYDRGALRVVDVADPTSPTLLAQYVFDELIDHATAYNNIIVDGEVAYIAIDYYGVEVVDISNPENIVQLAWYHPDDWAPATNDIGVWSNALGHANELVFDADCDRLYVAAGKSDVVALSVSDPTEIVECDTYGSSSDSHGTWGIDFFEDKIYAGYVWAPFTPPHSSFTGFRELSVSSCPLGIMENGVEDLEMTIFPNPAGDVVHIDMERRIESIRVVDSQGRSRSLVNSIDSHHYRLDISSFEVGMYRLIVSTPSAVRIGSIVKQ